jgi:DNA recombination protein RmuC
MDLMAILLLIIGIAVGFALGWLLKKSNSVPEINGSSNNQLNENIASLNARLEAAKENYIEQKKKIEALSILKDNLISDNSQLKEANQNLENKLNEHKKEVEQLQEKFKLEFQNIANRLLKQNSSEFAETNQKKLDAILNPLKENIKNFEKKVDDNYEKELKERTTLIEQIKSLEKLNTQMSEDAHNLTKALKGDNKAQGNWGELILEKILESSGLIENEEYETQYSTTNDEGSRIQPDILIKLPDDKHIIIDSKVSLIAYQEYINSENEDEQKLHLKNHVISVKSHIKGLSEKHYASAKDINSPDFVLLFMPIESSFGLAMKADNELYQYAWDKKVVIVTPSTLLATLKTIASVWKQDKQTKNAMKIAEESGKLYDKFVGFIEDLEKINKGLSSSKTAYDSAINKLKTGSGNLITKVENIRILGAKTKKQLPNDFLPEKDKQIEG